MGSRTLGAAALLLAASSASGFQVEANWDGVERGEADGFVRVNVEVTRDMADPAMDCQIDVTAAAQPFANSFPSEATPNEDYTPTTESFSIAVGASDFTTQTRSFDVAVLDDSLVEVTQPFASVVTEVSSPDCGGASFVLGEEDFVPISDNDTGNVTLSVDQSTVVVDESAGTVNVGVSLGGVSSVEGGFFVGADYTVTPGTATTPADYAGTTSGFLNFDENTLTQTITLSIEDDAILESTEEFTVQLSNVFGGLASEESLPVMLTGDTATVQIADNDSPGEVVFASTPYTVDETAGTATITLRRTGGTAGAIQYFYRAVEGSATDESDFESVSGSVQWADGEAGDKTFTVPILDDSEGEGDETVLIRAGTDSDFVEFDETTLTISDDEGLATASFSATTAAATEDSDEVVLTLVRGGGTAGTVTVDYATADGSAVAGEDYVASSGTVTWEDGDGADKTISIPLIEDGEQEEAEEFVVNLSNVTGPATLGSNSAITVTVDASDESRDIAEIANLNPNQAALAGFFDRTCSAFSEDPASLTPDEQELFTLCGVLRDVNTDDATVREALDAINPEELLVSTFNALQLTGVQHGNLNQRLNALRGGATGLSLTGLNLELGGQQIAGNALQEMFDNLVGGGASADEAGFGRWGAFINGRIADGDQDASENEAGFGFDLYSVTAGVDYRFKPNLIAGVSAGFGSVDADFDEDVGGMDIDSWNIGAYLTYFREESFYLDALATYGENDYDSQRRVAFSGGGATVDRIGRGKTDGKQFSVGVGSGWDFNRGGITFGPHFGGYFFDVDVDAFEETGAGGLNVAVDDQSSQSFTLNAGGHVSYAWLTDWGVLVPNAKIDWVHEFEDNRETLTFRFVNDPFAGDPGDPSPDITLQSNRPDSNYFIWSTGVSAQFVHGFSGFVNYQSYASYDDISLGEWSFGMRWEKTY